MLSLCDRPNDNQPIPADSSATRFRKRTSMAPIAFQAQGHGGAGHLPQSAARKSIGQSGRFFGGAASGDYLQDEDEKSMNDTRRKRCCCTLRRSMILIAPCPLLPLCASS